VVTAQQADRYADRIERILTAFTRHPDGPVGAIDIRTGGELRFGAGAHARPGPGRTLAGGFAAAARACQDAVAVSFGTHRLTYAELDDRASSVAATLRSLGVRPDSRVAIALPRSLDLVVAILAVVEAGGTYVPLDIDSPDARLRHILADSAPVCLLADHRDRLPFAGCPVVVVADAARSPVGDPPRRGDSAPGAHADHAAYIIYTSGSTGVPKGVAVTHRNVAALFDAAKPLFDFGPDDVWTMFHSAAFDFSVWELWGALPRGRLVVVEPEVVRDPDRFLSLLAAEGVTVLNQTPSAFYPLIEADRRRQPALSLRLRHLRRRSARRRPAVGLVEAGDVVAAVWFDRGTAEQGRLLLVVHHLAIDTVSWRIVIDDLGEACRQVRDGREIGLEPVPTSLRAYARALNENAQQAARLAEFEHWTTTLAPGGELLPEAPTVGLTVGATRDHELRLTVEETAALLEPSPQPPTPTSPKPCSPHCIWRSHGGAARAVRPPRTPRWSSISNGTAATGGVMTSTCRAPWDGSPR
jgi:AMP-binding enzyme/Condensation domain